MRPLFSGGANRTGAERVARDGKAKGITGPQNRNGGTWAAETAKRLHELYRLASLKLGVGRAEFVAAVCFVSPKKAGVAQRREKNRRRCQRREDGWTRDRAQALDTWPMILLSG